MPSNSPYGGRGPLLLGITWTECVLTTILIALRAYTHKKYPRQTIWPLFWAASSWIFGIGTQIFTTISIVKGIGNHIGVLRDSGTLAVATLWVWVGQSCTYISIGLGKIAAVSFILSIQGKTYPWVRQLFIALAIVNFLIDFAVVVTIWLQCTPSAALWQEPIKNPHCDNINKSIVTSYVSGSINAFTDILLALYPVSLLWGLQLKRRIKMGVGSLMTLGVFAGICAIVKTSQLPHGEFPEDQPYDIFRFVICACTEQWVVLIVISIPPLWVLVRPIIEDSNRYFKKSSHRRGISHTRRPGEMFQGKSMAMALTNAYAVNTQTESFIENGDPRRSSLPGDGILMTQNISVQQYKHEPCSEQLQRRVERCYTSGNSSPTETPFKEP